MSRPSEAPPIGDYALIGDCHGAALVSRAGSIDWCCLPRIDSESCFGRLLDWRTGGHCAILIDGESAQTESQSYIEDSLVLETKLGTSHGAARLLDFFATREGGADHPRRELVRIVECERGELRADIEVAARFDYGAVRPWLRRAAADAVSAVGGDSGLLISSDGETHIDGDSAFARGRLRAGERLRLVIRFARPHVIDEGNLGAPSPREIDERLGETITWWRTWRERIRFDGPDTAGVVRSALTLKALSYAPTGAIAAAATCSLPETLGGERNWDYRYSWIRDSALAAHALAELGCEPEAARSRHFIVRSSAGHAEDLQVLFGLGGERRLCERTLELDGYKGARPVRVGNRAGEQLQLDAYGEVLNLAWRWHVRGHSPDDDEWRFFGEVVEAAIAHWRKPDSGIWEWRGEPRHFVHSKAGCWAAVDRGLRLARECARAAPMRRWEHARDEIREAIESRGYDTQRGTFVQCFDEPDLDCALLLLPVMGFVAFDDERMVRTADAVREELAIDGFLRRYDRDDGLPGEECAFLPCCFWLAECYARQGRERQAREMFDLAAGAASPLGLLSEQFDPHARELMGNFPQTLTHLSHIAAAVALAESGERADAPTGFGP